MLVSDFIENGEYVRTKEGIIGKVKTNFMECEKMRLENDEVISGRGIVKHSHNIIELIEVGDILLYKDGDVSKILNIENDYFLMSEHSTDSNYYLKKEITFSDIESIVTHEQIERIKYIV